tara:strand:- start:162 stop:398 length:237 start_codon:yes stop_codon:yes gene_type:complete
MRNRRCINKMIQKISGWSDDGKKYAVLYKCCFSFFGRLIYLYIWIKPQIIFHWSISEKINKRNFHEQSKIKFCGWFEL